MVRSILRVAYFTFVYGAIAYLIKETFFSRSLARATIR